MAHRARHRARLPGAALHTGGHADPVPDIHDGTALLGVFAEESVTLDTLGAALCVYLLMGYTWSSLYGVIFLLTPGGFRLPIGWMPAREQGIATDVPMNLMTYFSFTTTLGYGDVEPQPFAPPKGCG